MDGGSKMNSFVDDDGNVWWRIFSYRQSGPYHLGYTDPIGDSKLETFSKILLVEGKPFGIINENKLDTTAKLDRIFRWRERYYEIRKHADILEKTLDFYASRESWLHVFRSIECSVNNIEAKKAIDSKDETLLEAGKSLA